MKLAHYAKAVAYDAAFWLSAFTNPDYPVEQLGQVCVDACAKLRTLAIIGLVAKGDHRLFTHNLVRSGRCRLSSLQRVQAAGGPDHHDASARIDPFFDAVAAADFALARQVAAASPRDWRQGHEYEDDWCHAQLAFSVIAPVADVARAQMLFQRWEHALQGQPDARLPVLRALVERDAEGFDPAFEALVQQHENGIAAERERARIEEYDVIAARQLFVNGLALLRMATQLGLKTQAEYRGCPSLGRQVTREPLPPEW
jgi:Immunity protein 49